MGGAEKQSVDCVDRDARQGSKSASSSFRVGNGFHLRTTLVVPGLSQQPWQGRRRFAVERSCVQSAVHYWCCLVSRRLGRSQRFAGTHKEVKIYGPLTVH